MLIDLFLSMTTNPLNQTKAKNSNLGNEDANLNENANMLMTPHIAAGQLPEPLEKALLIADNAPMRDMLLLSMLTHLGYALPAMRCQHGVPRHTYGPDLMTMVLAPAASGKGIMNRGRQLLSALENNLRRQVYIPANTSSAALINTMQLFGGRGIIMATELDTLSQTLRSPHGQFSDVLRCLFEHETISQLRRTRNEFIEIRAPHISVLLSGTLNQLQPLIKSRENGLMSRFACYVVQNRIDFNDAVWGEEADSKTADAEAHFARFAEQLAERFQWMSAQEHTCSFLLTDAQRQTVKRIFRSEYDNYAREYGANFDQSLKRMPVIMKRIGMILTGLRLDMSQPMPQQVFCSDNDFKTMLLIGHKLLMHAAMVYDMLPETKQNEYAQVSGSLQARQFFDMLPWEFSKSFADDQSRLLGLSVGTMQNWLTFWSQSGVLQRVEKGRYSKVA